MNIGGGQKSLGVMIRGDVTSLREALREGGRATKEFTNETRASMREAAAATEELNRSGSQSLNSFGGAFQRFLGPAALAGLAVQIGKVGFGFHDFMQKSELAFGVMLGSAGEAKEFLAEILEFAKETPFSFPELTASAQKMIAFGIESDKVVGILRTLGDATLGAGKGIAELDSLAEVLGKVQAKGRLQAIEINQIASMGIPALQVLANKAEVSVAEFQKQVTAGTIDADFAITSLVDGLRDGTDGVNGATRAFGGLTKEVKEAGGITATLDSTKSGFRNMAAAITESLIPSLIGLLGLTQDVMGGIKVAANVFGSLPAPIRNAALAVGALMLAKRLLNVEVGTKATSAWRGLTAAMSTATTGTRFAGSAAYVTSGRFRVMDATVRGAAASMRAAGAAAMSAFGGPLGIALTALTVGVAAYASNSGEAKRQTKEWKDSLDSVTGAATELTEELAVQQLTAERFSVSEMQFFPDGPSSIVADLELIGFAVEEIHEGWTNGGDAMGDMNSKVQEYYQALKNNESNDALERLTKDQALAIMRVAKEVDAHTKSLQDSRATKLEEIRVAKAGEKATTDAGDAYRQAALGVAAFSEEEQKAIDKAEESARKAFDSAFSTSGLNLNVSTLDDLAKAEDGVTQANRRVRDSEESLSDTRARKDVKTSEIRRAEEALADARKAAGEAADSLADVEGRRDPVKQYRKQLDDQLKAAQDFHDNIIKLGSLDLNAGSLMEIQAMGPEKAKDMVDAMLKDKSLIAKTNENRGQIEAMGEDLGTFLGLAQAGAILGGELIGEELMLAVSIKGQAESSSTVGQIAEALGQDTDTIREVGAKYGLTFLEGFNDYVVRNAVDMMRVLDPEGLWRDVDGSIRGGGTGTGGGGRGGGRGGSFFSGGIIPGYTPGRDTMNINVGGGEAIMRPEWTRAMTPGYVHKMNSIARSGGVDAVRSAMQGFGGSFYNGGIAGQGSSPQIIEVPVTSRFENHGVTTFGDIYAADMADIKRAARKSRRGAFTGGRPL